MKTGFYEKYIQSAESGNAVWLGDLRASAASVPGAERLMLRLTDCSGAKEDFPLFLPPWQGNREREFALSLLSAVMFNLLSARGGRELQIYFHKDNTALSVLVGELENVFQLRQNVRRGYGKAVNVSNRISAALGCTPFSVTKKDIGQYRPLHRKKESAPSVMLCEKLRAAAEEAENSFCCGMDVGGTDVKLAVSRGGRLLLTREFDWNPAQSPTADGLIDPLIKLLDEALDACGGGAFDAIGLCFPDVVIRDRILGGETPKTRGLRENPALDYEREFSRLGGLYEQMLSRCVSGGRVRIINDGNMAAFSAAMELSCGGENGLEGGVLAHTLGTDLGSGWLLPNGMVPELPLEMYDFLVDLGSFPQRRYAPFDLRSVCNENSGLPGARRYLGQAACYRIAWELKPSLLDGFTEESGGLLQIQSLPRDLRKPCLEHLMALAEEGVPEAEEIFLRIGRHLAYVNREMDFILYPGTQTRYLYGRFVKRARCFALIREGCAEIMPSLQLVAADENLACSPLMRQLAQRPGVTVAQFGQAVGAIYFALMEKRT